MRVAIVHDWLYGGGAEKVVLELHKMYPSAPIYTSYCTDEWRAKLDSKVITGYLNKWPFVKLRKFLPVLRQHWFRNLDLGEFDLVITSSGNGEAKFIQTRGDAKHICYCHTPPHFYWRKYNEYLENPGFSPKWLARLGLRLLAKPLRNLDYKAAQNVEYFIANSSHIQADIKKYYGCSSEVVHPPVNTERFTTAASENRRGFVTIGRLVPYKRVDIIIQACNQLALPLTVVGRGPDLARVQQLAGPTITFDANASDGAVAKYMASAEAFLFASFEDFGITPVEAMSAGTPIIAYKAGGALDYVVSGKTGEFFEEQSVDSLVEALKSFKPSNYNSRDIKQAAQKFSASNFQKSFQKFISSVLE